MEGEWENSPPKIAPFFEWLTEHSDLAQYLEVNSLFLPSDKNELNKVLEKRAESHKKTLEKLSNFFYDSLINSSPHEPIPYQISKLFLPKKVSENIRIYRFLSMKSHKYRLHTFNNAIKMCSELISLYGSDQIIPINVVLTVTDDFYKNADKEPDISIFIKNYAEHFLKSPITIITQNSLVAASQTALLYILKKVMKIYDQHLSYFPLTPEQEEFTTFLFSQDNLVKNEVNTFVSNFQSMKKESFIENTMSIHAALLKNYNIKDKHEISAIAMLVVRSMFDRCVGINYDYFFDRKNKENFSISPSFYETVKCSEIFLPESFIVNKNNSIKEEILKKPKLVLAINEIMMSTFLICPQDVLKVISDSMTYIKEQVTLENGLLDFDSTFGVFLATCIATGSPHLLSIIDFVYSFTPEQRIPPEFRTVLMMLSAARIQILTLANNTLK